MKHNPNRVKITSVNDWTWLDNLNRNDKIKRSITKRLKQTNIIFPESFSLFVENLLENMEPKNKNSIILFKTSEPLIPYELIIEPGKLALAKNYKEFVFKCEVRENEGIMTHYTEDGLIVFKEFFTDLFSNKEELLES